MDQGGVLLVDDDQEILNVFGFVLMAEAVTVVTAKSFSEALIELHKRRFDVLVTDLNMGPDGSGEALLEFAAAHYPRMRRILHSCATVPSDIKAHAVVDKTQNETLIRMVHALLREAANRPH